MRRRALHLSAALTAFAVGVVCASVLAPFETSWSRRLGYFVPACVALAGSAACLARAYRSRGRPGRSARYHLLMLSASGLLFYAGMILSIAALFLLSL